MHRIKKILFEGPVFKQFGLPEPSGIPLQVSGLKGSLKSIFLAYLSEVLDHRVVYISSDEDQAEQVRDDLDLICDGGQAVFFPAVEITPYEDRTPNPSLVRLRLETMQNLINLKNGVVVATGHTEQIAST